MSSYADKAKINEQPCMYYLCEYPAAGQNTSAKDADQLELQHSLTWPVLDTAPDYTILATFSLLGPRVNL